VLARLARQRAARAPGRHEPGGELDRPDDGQEYDRALRNAYPPERIEEISKRREMPLLNSDQPLYNLTFVL
jgi:hypothetical protein